jgi:hypothetical protein
MDLGSAERVVLWGRFIKEICPSLPIPPCHTKFHQARNARI